MAVADHLPYAFVAKITAAEGREEDLAELMTSALELAQQEDGTLVWFSVRTDDSTFWVFDAFESIGAREAHANGEIVAALLANEALLAEPPDILPAEVLAGKLP